MQNAYIPHIFLIKTIAYDFLAAFTISIINAHTKNAIDTQDFTLTLMTLQS